MVIRLHHLLEHALQQAGALHDHRRTLTNSEVVPELLEDHGCSRRNLVPGTGQSAAVNECQRRPPETRSYT